MRRSEVGKVYNARFDELESRIVALEDIIVAKNGAVPEKTAPAAEKPKDVKAVPK